MQVSASPSTVVASAVDLPAPRAADHGEVPGPAGQIDDERVAALLVGPVDQPDGAPAAGCAGAQRARGPAPAARARAPRPAAAGRPAGAARPGGRAGRCPAIAAMTVSRTVGPSAVSSLRRGAVARPPVRPAPARPGTGGPAAARGAGPARAAAPCPDRTRTPRGTGRARRCRWRGTPSRARTAAGARPARRGRPGTPRRRTCAARCGRTGATPARAAVPRRGAARPAAGAARASGPSRPIVTSRSISSGRCASSSENSSTTTNSAGSGGRSAPARRAAAYSADADEVARRPQQLLPTGDLAGQRVGHPVDEVSSSARFVITAETCGSPPSPRNVAPPLKSTSTRFSSADECVAASPRTSVRSSSLLPEPVAPMQSPCGPLPPCADSLRSSVTAPPRSSTPIGTRSRSASERRPRGRRTRGDRRPGRAARPSSAGSPVGAAGAGVARRRPRPAGR